LILKQGKDMTIHLQRNITQKFAELIKREWLETNGIGGWAGSTIGNCHTRRYHGLLISATNPPVGRVVLLSKMEETLVLGDTRIELGTNVYPGVVHPQGYRYLTDFSRDLMPSFTYQANGIVLQKSVAAIHGENTTVLLYQVIAAQEPFLMELRPFVAGRDYHNLSSANNDISQKADFTDDIFSYQPYSWMPTLYMRLPGTTFEDKPDWYYNFEYPIENERGLDYHEDLFTPGVFTIMLKTGDHLGIVISTESPASRDAEQLLTEETARRKNLLAALPVVDELTQPLTLAVD
jgi:predicted glycogen debranching enzyme